MKTLTADLWTVPCEARCITTNGAWRSDGAAVMGRGCALQAKQRYPKLAATFGAMLREFGNHVVQLRGFTEVGEPWLLSFPVKHTWDQRADLQLIARSADELVALTSKYGWQVVALPRPGCGNGGLRWEEVEPILAPVLDDRFLVVTK